MPQPLFALNDRLDRAALAERFARDGRVQIRDVLTTETAETLRRVIVHDTPYGFAYLGENGRPARLDQAELAALAPDGRAAIGAGIQRAAARGEYAVRFNSYPILDAYLDQRRPGGPHDILMEHLNAEPFLDLVRAVTAIPELIKADAQATIFAPGDFLSLHSDSHVGEGWRIAYVLNLTDRDWSPDWGGYLNFFDAEGDIVAGWLPRFNTLNLFAVPQPHNVSYVPSFAPAGRFAITGWLRDR